MLDRKHVALQRGAVDCAGATHYPLHAVGDVMSYLQLAEGSELRPRRVVVPERIGHAQAPPPVEVIEVERRVAAEHAVVAVSVTLGTSKAELQIDCVVIWVLAYRTGY